MSWRRNRQLLNCGYGRGYSVKEVIAAVRSITGVDFEVHQAPRRAGDPASIIANKDGVGTALGWKPEFNDLPTHRNACSSTGTIVYGPNLVRLLVPLHRGCDFWGSVWVDLTHFARAFSVGEHPFNAGACSHFSVDLAPGMHVAGERRESDRPIATMKWTPEIGPNVKV